MNCPVCNDMTQRGMCLPCKTDPQRQALILGSRIRSTERTFFNLCQVRSAKHVLVRQLRAHLKLRVYADAAQQSAVPMLMQLVANHQHICCGSAWMC